MTHTHSYNRRIQSGLATHYRRPFINHAQLTSQLLQSHAHTRPIDPPRELLMKQANHSFPSYIDFHGIRWSILSKRPTQLRNHSINTHRHTLSYTHTDTHTQTHHLHQYDRRASARTGPRPSPTPSECCHLTHWPRARRSAPPPPAHTIITHIFVHSYIHMISKHNSCIWHTQALYIYKHILAVTKDDTYTFI